MDEYIKLALPFYHWNLIYCNHGNLFVCILSAILNVQALETNIWCLDLSKLLAVFSFSIHKTLRKWPYGLIKPRGPLYMLHSQLYKLAMPKLYEAKLPINAWQFHKYWGSECATNIPGDTSVDNAGKWPPVLLIYMEADRMLPWSLYFRFIIACKGTEDHN